MRRKLISWFLIIGVFAVLIIAQVMFKKARVQTCTYEDEERKISTVIPSDWTYEVEPRIMATEEFEGSPNYGINIYIDGNKENNIYVFYQLGSIKFAEPGMVMEDFQTTKGEEGTLYTVLRDTTATVFAHFDNAYYGHYAATTTLNKNIYGKKKKKIMSVIEHIEIEEK